MTQTPDSPETITAACIEGVGCTYFLRTDDNFDLFDLVTVSGPHISLPTRFESLPDALRHIANEIDSDLGVEQ